MGGLLSLGKLAGLELTDDKGQPIDLGALVQKMDKLDHIANALDELLRIEKLRARRDGLIN